jgi:hypothetical protein
MGLCMKYKLRNNMDSWRSPREVVGLHGMGVIM